MPKVPIENSTPTLTKKTYVTEVVGTPSKEPTNGKLDQLESVGVKEPKRRGRPKGSKNKREIEKKLSDELQIGEKAISKMTEAVFLLAEGVSSIWMKPAIPFTQVNKDTKAGFDKSVTTCMEYYLPAAEIKHLPLIYLGVTTMALSMEVLHIRHEQKVALAKKKAEDTLDEFPEELTEEPNVQPIEVRAGI